tara:strand:- start:7145 stop:7591 length:447 start_codon:yes stop_codon:yes gene_type:complete
MENEAFKEAAEHIIGTYGWFVLAGFLTFFLKDGIQKAAEGFMVFMGKDFQNDDILYISGRQARIVRVGCFKTIFYMTDRGTKMVVPNDRLKMLVVEKSLPKNGGFAYLYKAGEPGYEKQNQLIKKMSEVPDLSEKESCTNTKPKSPKS